MRPKELIPSMFHRRLWLLFLGMVALSGAMLAQTWRLTVAQGSDLRRLAESRLVSERWTPSVRGRILDRKGRVLARDEPSFDLFVDYKVITEEWAYSQAATRARQDNRALWAKLDRKDRDELIRRYLPEQQATLTRMWDDLADALQIDREEIESRKTAIRRDVQHMSMTVWERMLEKRREELNRDRETSVEVTLSDVQKPLAVQEEPHCLARGVDEETGRRINRLIGEYPGLHLEQSGRREYPYESMDVPIDRSTFPTPLRDTAQPVTMVPVDGVATHVLGWLRQLHAEDLERRPRIDPVSGAVDAGHYQHGDLVGARGIESACEAQLRGLRGRRLKHLDTGKEELIAPKSGEDVQLSLDVMLQARVQALMSPPLGLASVQPWHHSADTPPDQPAPLPDGTALNGAAVVLDIDTGEILAMVSTPSFTRRELKTDGASLFNDPVDTAWVNRCIAKPYPPGSIVKPLVLAAAVTERTYRLDRPIECTGHLLPNVTNRFRCWVYKQHHTTHSALLGRSLLAPEALAVSCNIFYYTLGRELGPERLAAWYKRFGVGTPFGLNLGEEYAGVAGVVPKGEIFSISHATLMGIGQGPVAWTPLHAADAYATIARGGLRIVPRVIRSQSPRAVDLKIDPGALDAALEGLRQSVQEEYGTGHFLKLADGTRERVFTDWPSVEVIGKTGTAEAPDILSELDPNDPVARTVLREGDHSWFVIMAGKKGGRPRYAIAVVMEYAGSGGRVSGPIANQIVGALIEEGYL